MGVILLYFAIVFAFIAAVVNPLVLAGGNIRIHFGWLAVAFYLLHLVMGGGH